MASIFTKIINGQIPCYKVTEDANYFAFLDINPNAPGHTLCVPKQEVDNIFDLDTKTYLGLFAFAKNVAQAIAQVTPCERVALSVIGLEVPHAHIHLIPINSMNDANFSHKIAQSEVEFREMAHKIKQALK